ncbi:cupin domain-containing protein [Aquibacillus saliphilus]|uniref:cupin domain-containing protein n=1 Tax=Aquibacillus saliphilus TaxID=1909422 RepID=UPI001CF02565|nr:cupin domain-containing protein [Aquibacillus saliphilus]
MYYNYNTYPYPYYANASIYQSDIMARNSQENSQQIINAILARLNKEASAIDFYSRLANIAPQEHKSTILQTLEDKQVHVKQFTDLFINLTGRQPVYHIDKVAFQTYQEGIQKAYDREINAYEEDRFSPVLHVQHPLVSDVFSRVLTAEKEHANRFGFLKKQEVIELRDYGADPFVVNIEKAAKQNKNYRTALWTGDHLQVTLMSIKVGGDIGLETHPNLDQFIRIDQGQGLVQMGDSKDNLTFKEKVYDNYAIIIPAGKWHNLTNTGNEPIKLYSIYAPPQHPFGTVHETKEIAMAAEEEHDH